MSPTTTDPLAFLTLDTWITSDSHWSHENIRKYQGRPDDHFALMHRQWTKRVGAEEPILHLGDLVCFGNPQAHPTWLNGLTGVKYLLKGNHDKHSNQWYEAAGFSVLGRRPLLWFEPESEALLLFSHEPAAGTSHEPWDINIHGHTHLNTPYTTLGRLDDRINVCVERTEYAPVRLRDVLAGATLRG